MFKLKRYLNIDKLKSCGKVSFYNRSCGGVVLHGRTGFNMADWSKEWNYCRRCITTTHKHASEGYCKPCFAIIIQESKPKKVTRQCLSCGETFNSKWIGNRRCENCLRREREGNFIDKDTHRVSLKS